MPLTAQDIHQLLVDEFGDDVIVGLHEALDPWIEVHADRIVDVCLYLRDNEQTDLKHLNDLTAVDYFEPDESKREKFGHEEHLAVVYHLTSLTHKHACVLKVKLPRWKDDTPGQLPEVLSLSGVFGIADWHERECYDMFGIRFLGHPNLRRILCPEDWVGHPLRKDYEFPLEYHGVRGR